MPFTPDQFLGEVHLRTPSSEVRTRIGNSRNALHDDSSIADAVKLLGNGKDVSAQDTVPSALWVASRHLDSYVDALWNAVSALGDRDTICAIVGGIVSMSAELPAEWLNMREAL